MQALVFEQRTAQLIVFRLRILARRDQALLDHALVQLDEFALLDEAIVVQVVELIVELLQEALEVQRLRDVLIVAALQLVQHIDEIGAQIV